VLLPSADASAAGQPAQVVLAVHQPRVVLVRRFMNNVLYVMALMSHEVDAAGRAQQQQQQVVAAGAGGQQAQAPSQQQQADLQDGSSTAVLLLTLTGMQVGPRVRVLTCITAACECAHKPHDKHAPPP
jgi:hypothetical protein